MYLDSNDGCVCVCVCVCVYCIYIYIYIKLDNINMKFNNIYNWNSIML